MILFIDDEPHSIEAYIHAVATKGLDVKLLKSIKEVDQFLRESVEPRCVVLDVMLPVDKGMPGNLTSGGLTTGTLLFASLRSRYSSVPVVVLTNSMSLSVKAFFRDQDNCAFYYKTDLIPEELARIVVDLAKDTGGQLIKQLELCLPGRSSARQFEALCVAMLDFLFVPPFKKIASQVRRANGHDIRDAIVPNTAPDYFWASLRRELDAKNIVVEFKNYTEPVGKEEVLQLRDYLARKSLGRFGLLVSRLPPSESALIARTDAYSDQNCLILFLDDEDLRKMLEIRRRGGDPSAALEQMKEQFEWAY